MLTTHPSTKDSLPLGKLWGLRRLANDQGHFTMVALDQRPPIVNLIAAKRGIDPSQVKFEDVVAIKRLLVDVLGRYASAMLLDPNYAFPAALAQLPSHKGLVVTLEDHRFVETPGGRLSRCIDNWSVGKIKRAGGDGVKVLAWYRPDATPAVCRSQLDFVQEIGQQCREHDIAFILELLVYPMQQTQSADYIEAPEKMPAMVMDSVRAFCDPRFGVDLLKLECPMPAASLPGRDGGSAHRQAQERFDQLGKICRDAGLPWVMLSAGVSAEQFIRVMEYAYEAGANGFLAGRAIWSDALQAFPDMDSCRRQLSNDGPITLQHLISLTARHAHSWQPDYSGLTALEKEGDLCQVYA